MKEKNQRLYQNLKPYIIVSFRSMKRLPATKPILKITESNSETERERQKPLWLNVRRILWWWSNPTMRKAEIECHRFIFNLSPPDNSAAVHARHFIAVVEIVAVRNHVLSDHNIVPAKMDSLQINCFSTKCSLVEIGNLHLIKLKQVVKVVQEMST